MDAKLQKKLDAWNKVCWVHITSLIPLLFTKMLRRHWPVEDEFFMNPMTGKCLVPMLIFASLGGSLCDPTALLLLDSRMGNNPFDFCGHLSPLSVKRRSNKCLPRCPDTKDSAVWISFATENLMPAMENRHAATWTHSNACESYRTSSINAVPLTAAYLRRKYGLRLYPIKYSGAKFPFLGNLKFMSSTSINWLGSKGVSL